MSMAERSKTEEVHVQSSTLSQRSSHDDSKLTFDSDDLTEIFVKHLFDQDLGSSQSSVKLECDGINPCKSINVSLSRQKLIQEQVDDPNLCEILLLWEQYKHLISCFELSGSCFSII